MSDSQSTSPRSRLVQAVHVRRKGKSLGQVPTRSLAGGIEKGELLPDDEFSGDGLNWTRLDTHHQLAPLFQSKPSSPGSRMDLVLDEMAGLLKDINGS